MHAVSIIIPVYNQNKYLKSCLESIISQSFGDFEVILVDDGSTDSSCLIYNVFVKGDDRFVVLKKNNGGVSSARNVGLDNATGEYVLFVDSDDILPSDALEKHVKCFSEKVDMTIGAFVAFSDDNPEIYRVDVERNEVVSTEKSLHDFTPSGQKDWQRYLWNRMMRMSIIKENNLRFNEKIAYKEDGLFLVQYLLKCKGNVAYFPDIVYYYRQNPSSAMGSLDSGHTNKLVTNIDAHALIIKAMKGADVPDGILEREIQHAFQSRRWVLGKLYHSNYYINAWMRTLVKLFNAVGVSITTKIVAESIDRKVKGIFHQNKR